MRRLQKHTIIFFLSLVLGLSACNLDIPTENELTDPDVIVSVHTAYEALSTAYASYPQSHFLLSILADDFAPLTNVRLNQAQLTIYHWESFQLQEQADLLWREYYKTIVNINAVLTRLPALYDLLPENQHRSVKIVQAEAEGLKALCYLDLIQTFATRFDDPYKWGILLKNNVEEEALPRTSKEECVAEIERLLLSAEQLFLEAEGVVPMHGGRPTFITLDAIHMLSARLHLYTSSYERAELFASKVWDKRGGDFSSHMVNDWREPKATQTIFSKAISGKFYTDIYISSPRVSDMTLMLNPELDLDPNDLRRGTYLLDSIPPSSVGGRTTFPLLGKFNLPNIQFQEIRQVPIIRIIEALFIIAEAQARQGKDSEATELMNRYLSAVGGTTIPDTTRGAELVTKILHEKHKEFAGENLRFHDMKRCGLERKTFSFNAQQKINTIRPDDYRWTLPIPRSEYRTNRSITEQNPGWPEFERIRLE